MRQIAVIGLGQFGISVAKTLVQEGVEVIAIDRKEEKIQEVRDVVSQAVKIDATDEKALITLGIPEVDVAIVSIGQNIQQSILVTLLLKEIGVKEIVAKAITPLHGRVLEKIGVDKIVSPEIDTGVRIARSLAFPNILRQIEVSSRHSIVEILAPERFVGKTLKEINIRERYGVNIIAIKREITHIDDKGDVTHVDEVDISPKADDMIAKGDILIVFGDNESMKKIRE
ncbi:MAG: TrkA family potassium uptake protein [bacterium]|nr:TrkA family potassium uptake protein [bacterium]